MNGNNRTSLARSQRSDKLLLSGSEGLFEIARDGLVRRYTNADGLPHTFVRCFREDRAGNFWVGTS